MAPASAAAAELERAAALLLGRKWRLERPPLPPLPAPLESKGGLTPAQEERLAAQLRRAGWEVAEPAPLRYLPARAPRADALLFEVEAEGAPERRLLTRAQVRAATGGFGTRRDVTAEELWRKTLEVFGTNGVRIDGRGRLVGPDAAHFAEARALLAALRSPARARAPFAFDWHAERERAGFGAPADEAELATGVAAASSAASSAAEGADADEKEEEAPETKAQAKARRAAVTRAVRAGKFGPHLLNRNGLVEVRRLLLPARYAAPLFYVTGELDDGEGDEHAGLDYHVWDSRELARRLRAADVPLTRALKRELAE